MGVDVKSEYIELGGSNVLLVSVRGSTGLIGVCSTGHNVKSGDMSALGKTFYIGSEPALSIICSNNGDKRTDSIISQCTGFAGMANDVNVALTESFNKINRGDSLENGLRDIFTLLSDGVYTVYASEYYPTDGSGTFFWGAYNIPHEVHGSAQYNRAIGMEKTYRPCFLIPGNTLDNYTPKRRGIADEAVKSRKYQGIVYHLSGLHSVLLKGHMGAVSCVAAELPYRCAVIERIDEPYSVPVAVKKAAPKAPVQTDDNGADAAEQEIAPAPVEEYVEREGITGFRSASVKIPLELFPADMLRNILENRHEKRPGHYHNISQKRSAPPRHRVISNNSIPMDIHEKSELMPDCEMIESAYALSSLSEGQIEALLAGETEYEGKLIISANFYASIVTACNYLRFHDEKRFIQFAIQIMDNPELYATHEYVAKRVCRLNNKKLYQFFKSALVSDDSKYEKILTVADRYVKDYDVKHK